MSYENYLDINIDGIDGMKKKLKKLGDKAPVAMYRAINDAAKKARTEMDKNVRKKYTIKQEFVLDSLDISYAHRNKLNAFIYSKGGAIPLAEFKTTPAKPAPKRKKPIRVSVKRDGGTKPLGRDPKAFVAILKGDKVVAERTSGDRGPLIGLFGPAAPSVIKNEEVMSGVKEEAMKKLSERLDHHIEHLLIS